MSAESTDRLYDEGCCLCGSAVYLPRSEPLFIEGRLNVLRGGFANEGASWCGDCFTDHGRDAARMDREITRRKSLVPRPAPPEKFKVGDRVSGTDGRPHRTVTGTIIEITSDARVFVRRDDGDGWLHAVHGNGCWELRPDSLRPIPPQLAPGSAGSVGTATREDAAPGARKDAGVFEPTQPSEPGHSPATPGRGKTEVCICCGAPCSAQTFWRCGGQGPFCSANCGAIRPPKPDPYAEHRKRDTFGDDHKRETDGSRRFERLLALHRSKDPLDRLAAKRAVLTLDNLSDLDRSSSSRRAAIGRAWRDKMGNLVSWTGRVK